MPHIWYVDILHVTCQKMPIVLNKFQYLLLSIHFIDYKNKTLALTKDMYMYLQKTKRWNFLHWQPKTDVWGPLLLCDESKQFTWGTQKSTEVVNKFGKNTISMLISIYVASTLWHLSQKRMPAEYFMHWANFIPDYSNFGKCRSIYIFLHYYTQKWTVM